MLDFEEIVDIRDADLITIEGIHKGVKYLVIERQSQQLLWQTGYIEKNKLPNDLNEDEVPGGWTYEDEKFLGFDTAYPSCWNITSEECADICKKIIDKSIEEHRDEDDYSMINWCSMFM